MFEELINTIINQSVSDEEDNEDEKEVDDLNENFIHEILKDCDGYEISKKEIESLIKEVGKCHINKGVKCLKNLMERKDSWIRSSCIKYGLYSERSTNRVEGFFGNLKSIIKHKRLLLFQLTSIIQGLSNGRMNNIKTIELNEKILKREEHDKISYIGKQIMNKQFELMIVSSSKTDCSKCRSCNIRKFDKDRSWPCWHIMKEEFSKNDIIFDLSQLPKIVFKSKDLGDIQFYDCGIKNIKTSNETVSSLRGIKYISIKHNSNSYQRSYVDRKIRIRKNGYSQIEIINDEKWKLKNKKKKLQKRNMIESDSERIIQIEIDKKETNNDSKSGDNKYVEKNGIILNEHGNYVFPIIEKSMGLFVNPVLNDLNKIHNDINHIFIPLKINQSFYVLVTCRKFFIHDEENDNVLICLASAFPSETRKKNQFNKLINDILQRLNEQIPNLNIFVYHKIILKFETKQDLNPQINQKNLIELLDKSSFDSRKSIQDLIDN